MELKLEINSLKKAVAAGECQADELRSEIDSLRQQLTTATSQLRDATSAMVDVQDKLDQMTEENEILKNVEAGFIFVQHLLGFFVGQFSRIFAFYPRLNKCHRRSQIFPVAFRRFGQFRSFGII